MTKQEIRKENLKRRSRLLGREEKNKTICQRFLSLAQYRAASTVMIYLSYRSEPDTHALATQILQDGKRLCAPVCGQNGLMDSYVFSDLSSLSPSEMQILEPPRDKPVLPDEIDLIVVPGCAFNESGYRLGYGSGYYDRYLRRTHAFTCGFFYDALKTDFTPEETDVPLHCIITETRIYHFT